MRRTKRVNRAGAITLPKALRAEAGIPIGAAVDINGDNEYIYISKHVPICRFCSRTENVFKVIGIEICRVCAEKITAAKEAEEARNHV